MTTPGAPSYADGAAARTGPSAGRALILEHGTWGPPGVLGDWLAARGIEYDVHRCYEGDPLPDDIGGYRFVASLGSPHNPDDLHEPDVAAERAWFESALDSGVPVLGLCFGGQLLAALLGGTIEEMPEPELGWHEVETDDPRLVPPGPWLQWHYQRFTLPPGATEVARSPTGVQAFTHGPHLGVQFHPESTIPIVRQWAESDAERLAAHGIEDGPDRLEQGREHAAAAVRQAHVFFDAFLARANSIQEEKSDA